MRDDAVTTLTALWDRAASGFPGTVAVHLRSLHGTVAAGRRSKSRHYAASTMKLAVVVAASREIGAGRLHVGEELEIRDTFPSAAGGLFTTRAADDQDEPTWQRLGRGLPAGTLLERMIVDSSNIATNVVLDRIGLHAVRGVLATAHADLTVNRLIGDERAEAGGITNTVTARGLSQLMASLATGRLLPADATRTALDLLARQRHTRMIPAGLPNGTWCASKGGWNGTVNHDVALIRPPHAPPYVLAVCTTTGRDEAAARLVARLSAVTWEHWIAAAAGPAGPPPDRV